MKNKFNMSAFIKLLTSISERQLRNETKAADLIIKTLSQHTIPCSVQNFITSIPLTRKSLLLCDHQKIYVRATALVSGTISSKNSILSSLISSQKNITDPNINFNPQCKAVSRSNHYFAPSLAISPHDIPKILGAKKIKGTVRVKRTKHRSQNILVGNTRNPKNILFCHYDSFGPGALDNASGTTLLLKLIIDFPETLKNTLYVIAGNEELSYDFPTYWGHGYRVFEKKYFSLLKKCGKIFVVDCIGNGEPIFDNYSSIVRLSFPIKNLEYWKRKIYAVYGDEEKLMKVYHSDLDTPSLIRLKYLDRTLNQILHYIK